jgi:glycosyltransferase involved in cell wall biosynthesis
VAFLGHRDDAESLISGLDVLVVPSDHEGHPMVVLEAMRAGVPIVATRVGGVPEVLGNSRWVVSPNAEHGLSQAVQELLANSAQRQAWAEALRNTFRQRYTIETMADRVLSVYHDVMREGGW